MISDLCVPLDSVRSADLQSSGGKGANLGELLHAGFAVPHGFVITTDAYRTVIASLPDGETPTQDGILATTMPTSVRESVLAGYSELGDGPVAVRSSATAEDLPGAAFAGQQDTFLGVIGADQLLDAVRKCWASLWTERAVAYRERLHIDESTVAIAVVVQRLVAAEVAGVMFTADPVTGVREHTIIDSSPGLGEAVVSGLVTPDHALLNEQGTVIERTNGRRESVIISDPAGGTTTLSGDSAPARVAPLDDSELARLAEVGRRIAAHFGRPQDIEWAFIRGEFTILQARPMTALPPAPIRLSHFQRMLGPIILELLPRRPYPLELSFWIKQDVGRLVDGMLKGLAGLSLDFNEVLPSVDAVVQSYVPPVPRPSWAIPAKIFRSLGRTHRDPSGWQDDPLLVRFLSETANLDTLSVADLDWDELLTVPLAAASATDLVTELRVLYLPAAGSATVRLTLLLKMLRLGHLAGDLNADTPTQTSSANSALTSLAATVRDRPALAAAFADLRGAELQHFVETDARATGFRAELDAFLAQFGHRESTSILLLRDPTWIDAPEIVLALVGALVSQSLESPGISEPGDAHGGGEHARARSGSARSGEARSGAARDRVLHSRFVRALGLRRAVSKLMVKAAAGAALREDTHFEATRPMPIVRRTMVEIGARLAESGVIDVPDDVWFLTWPEIQTVRDPDAVTAPGATGAELAAAARRRKDAYAELAGSPLIARSTLYRTKSAAQGALVSGAGAGAGLATGPVRVVHGPEEFGLVRAGDVLVCPSTSPAWTPLFALVCAVVVDNGGLASHAAIVAREYGIPAVMGCGDGTSVLTDGQWVTVDGSRGVVLPHENTPEGNGAAARA